MMTKKQAEQLFRKAKANADYYAETVQNLADTTLNLENICEMFDDDTAAVESDWHVASRVSFCTADVEKAIDALNEMSDWYMRRLDVEELKLKKLRAIINADVVAYKPAKAKVATRLCPATDAEARKLWLSENWNVDIDIRQEADDGTIVELTEADFKAVEETLRGRYYITWDDDRIFFFADSADWNKLNKVFAELESRGCWIDELYDEWQWNKDDEKFEDDAE